MDPGPFDDDAGLLATRAAASRVEPAAAHPGGAAPDGAPPESEPATGRQAGGELPARPWRRGGGAAHGRAAAPRRERGRLALEAEGVRDEGLARGRGTTPRAGTLRASCVLIAGDDPAELEAAGMSALRQSVAFGEVLVAEPDPEGRAGELERVQHTLAAARGELVFFLRAGDRFEPGHLERCLAVYDAHPTAGLVDSAYRRFGRREEPVQRPGAGARPEVQACLARARGAAPLCIPALSALSVRRGLLARVLPFPDEVLEDWAGDAAEPLLRAAAGSGRPRGYVALEGARVRVDDAALGLRPERDRARAFERHLALARLTRHLDRRQGHGAALARLVHAEYRLLPRPTRAQLAAYLRLARDSDAGAARRAWMALSILGHHLRPAR